MKKFSSFTGMLLTAILVVVVFAACQKEQSSTVNQETASTSSDETTIVRTAGTGNLPGEISPSYAAALAANFSKEFANEDEYTQYVAFNAKDLVAFINNLQNKYKSDIVYVNFGLYGKDAPAVNSKNNGRLTVFFTGNKIPAPNSSARRNNGIFDLTTVTDEFLNHGQLVP